jgi:hypothetical protein
MPACTACGNHLTTDYVRVFGDNDGTIDACPHCPPAPARRTDPTAAAASDAGGRDEAVESGGIESHDPAVDRSEPAAGSAHAVTVTGRSLEPPTEPTGSGSSRADPPTERPGESRGAARDRPPRGRVTAALSTVVQALR